MSTYGYHSSKPSKSYDSFHMNWIVFLIMALFLLWAPFRTALFNGQTTNFEQPIYIAVLWSSLIGLFTIALIYNKKHWTKIDVLAMIMFLVPISYALSIINAASQYLAINMLIITSLYVFFFITALFITGKNSFNRIMVIFITSISYLIVFFGLFHWFGNGPFINLFVKWLGAPTLESGAYRDAVMVDANGARLTSVFQYANTYAAYLMAFLFAAVFLVGQSRVWWSKFIHGFMLVPIILSIFLTLSRGGLVLLPVVFVVLLVFLKPHRQLMWILHLAVSGIVTVLILNPVTDFGLQLQTTFTASQSLKGWIYVIVGSLISGGLSVALEKWISPLLEKYTVTIANKKWGTFLIPIGSMIIGALLLFVLIGTSAKNILPENIQTRLENINFEQHSVLERLTFYKDAIKVVKDYPVIGAGGGAWSALYQQYQNNPYTSNQAHNFYLQYLVETGILGFVIFAALLIYIIVQYIRNYIRATDEKRGEYFVYFIIAISLLIHSILDFNMSYVYLGIIVFICLGAMSASVESPPLNLKIKAKTFGMACSTVLATASIALLITSITFISSVNAYQKADEASKTTSDYNLIVSPLNKSLSGRSYQPDSVALKAALLTQVYKQTHDDSYYQEAEKLLKDALNVEPYNKKLLNGLIELYQSKNNEEEIVEVYQDNAYRYPWDIDWLERYMYSSIQLASSVVDQTKKDQYLNAVLTTMKQIEDGVEYLKTLPEGQFQGRPFEVTPKIALYSGKAHFLLGQVQESYELLKPYLQDDLSDVTNEDIMTWYLASSVVLGINDEASMSKLLQFNPNGQANIDIIVAMNNR